VKIQSLDDLVPVRQYLARIGADVRSLKTAVIKEVQGSYWRDTAIISFHKDGTVSAPDPFAPTDLEKAAITQAFVGVDWPVLKKVRKIEKPPKEIKEAADEDVFEFRDENDMIVMVQVRMVFKEGEKVYIPFTYWDDGIWRKMEPDGPLPLWGLEALKDNTTVIIHEGAKAARKVRTMVEGATAADRKERAAHPWGEELSGACHLGWIGGALSPARTDWSVLKRKGVKIAYIVSDNDQPGVAAVPAISQQLNIVTFHVQFTNEWPVSFDLADRFPDHMFKELEGIRRYIGPSFRACLHPATWATDLIPNPRGKPTPVLREHFKDLWAYVEEADVFICTQMPEIMRSDQILNKMLAGFSHTQELSRLIVRSYNGRSTKLCYRPDMRGRMVTDGTTSAINLHTPSMVRAEQGDIKPFMDFMEYMFPNSDERKQVTRWVATLVGRPDIRMEYGLLLVSEKQGIGKTTLGSAVLAPLVGTQNVGWPSENDITNGNFNDWIANRRLVIVNEIYSGHSWKAYNRLKSLITDSEVQVNQKYMRQYTIQNWCHIFACSNSRRALRMEEDDRRWFYPEITEERWPKESFEKFRRWLSSGGLGIIKTWAMGYGDYVLPGQRAPMTEQKKELIEGSRSEAQLEAAQIAEAMINYPEPCALAMKTVVMAVRAQAQGRVFESDYELRKTMNEVGIRQWKTRLKIAGRMQHVMVNDKLYEILKETDEERQSEVMRKHTKKLEDIITTEM
jgi:hypothetical protein